MFWLEYGARSFETMSEEETRLQREFSSYAELMHRYLCCAGKEGDLCLTVHRYDKSVVPIQTSNVGRMSLCSLLANLVVDVPHDGKDQVFYENTLLFSIACNPADARIYKKEGRAYAYVPEGHADEYRVLWMSESALLMSPMAFVIEACRAGEFELRPPASFGSQRAYATIVDVSPSLTEQLSLFSLANVRARAPFMYIGGSENPAIDGGAVLAQAALVVDVLRSNPIPCIVNSFEETIQACDLAAAELVNVGDAWRCCAGRLERVSVRELLNFMLENGFNFLAEFPEDRYDQRCYGKTWVTQVVPQWLGNKGVRLENGLQRRNHNLGAQRPSPGLRALTSLLIDNHGRDNLVEPGAGWLPFAFVADAINPSRFRQTLLPRGADRNSWVEMAKRLGLYDITRLDRLLGRAWPFCRCNWTDRSCTEVKWALGSGLKYDEEDENEIFDAAERDVACRICQDVLSIADNDEGRRILCVRDLEAVVGILKSPEIDDTRAVIGFTALACRVYAQKHWPGLLSADAKGHILSNVKKLFRLKYEGLAHAPWRFLQYDCALFEIGIWLSF